MTESSANVIRSLFSQLLCRSCVCLGWERQDEHAARGFHSRIVGSDYPSVHVLFFLSLVWNRIVRILWPNVVRIMGVHLLCLANVTQTLNSIALPGGFS